MRPTEPIDVDQLSAAELEALQVDFEGKELERNRAAERWWLVSLWATVIVCVVVGLLMFLAGRAKQESGREMGGGFGRVETGM